jgi:predicted esterase
MKRILAPAHSVVDFLEYGNKESTNKILLLHGYGQNNEVIYEDFKDLITNDCHWIIPNGFFPIPKKRPDKIIYRYAWYFYNDVKQQYFIDFKYPVEVIKSFLNIILPSSGYKLKIIGYSQGGYLAPFLGQAIDQTEQVIGINCNYRVDMLEKVFKFQLDAIHGQEDGIVDPNNSYHSFSKIQTRYPHFRYKKLEHYGHELNSDYLDNVKELLTNLPKA